MPSSPAQEEKPHNLVARLNSLPVSNSGLEAKLIGPRQRDPRAHHNLLNHPLLAEIIPLHRLPLLLALPRSLPLRLHIQFPICRMRHQPLPKPLVAAQLRRPRLKHMHIGIWLRQPKEAMLVPVRLAEEELEPGGLQGRGILVLGGGVWDDEVDVDDGFGGQAGDTR